MSEDAQNAAAEEPADQSAQIDPTPTVPVAGRIRLSVPRDAGREALDRLMETEQAYHGNNIRFAAVYEGDEEWLVYGLIQYPDPPPPELSWRRSWRRSRRDPDSSVPPSPRRRRHGR